MNLNTPTKIAEAQSAPVGQVRWPLYYRDVIDVGNIGSNVAVVCLWTERTNISSLLPMEKVCAVGQLYSHNRGISALIRNILLNPVIDTIVLCGIDKSGSGKALLAFFEEGVDKDNTILGIHGGQLDLEISKAAIELVRKNIKIINLRNEWKIDKILPVVEQHFAPIKAWSECLSFPEPEYKKPDTLPSEQTSIVLRGKNMIDVWPRVLAHIMDFGTIKKSQYVEDQRELITVITEINDDPDNPKLADWLPFTKEELLEYYPQVISGEGVEGVNYTYGQRLFRFSDNKLCVNQIENIIKQLKAEPYTRRAVAVTWDVTNDYNNDHAPCLDLIQALIQNNKLFMVAFLRSNDMYKAWPRNALALRKLQSILANGVGIEMGSLTVISSSAHIYETDFTDASNMANKRGRKGTHVWNEAKQSCIWTETENDHRGVMVISVQNEKIVVEQRNWQTGEELRVFEGKSAVGVYSDLAAANAIGSISHALDIGCELQKAEIALAQNIPYTQDQPLIFDQSNKELISRWGY